MVAGTAPGAKPGEHGPRLWKRTSRRRQVTAASESARQGVRKQEGSKASKRISWQDRNQPTKVGDCEMVIGNKQVLSERTVRKAGTSLSKATLERDIYPETKDERLQCVQGGGVQGGSTVPHTVPSQEMGLSIPEPHVLYELPSV